MNHTTGTDVSPIDSDDATWILTSAFIIFTMQSGFGLLESGMVSRKNEANIMVKNAVDVIYGGLAYWLFGFALSFSADGRGNSFCGLGKFFTDADEDKMGQVFSKYFFQLSFATTATTVVSGAMAERTNLKAYILYSFLNTLTFSFPAHWIWDKDGWLRNMEAVDIAGCSAVHLVGGVSGLVATLMLKPRTGRFDNQGPGTQMASPINVLLGTFMLWWGWLGFNCGSTFGISGHKWKLASRAAVVTINGSVGGGIVGTFYSYKVYKGKLNITVFVTGILAGLVSITGGCSIILPWEALVIGAVGAMLACLACDLLEWLKIDDPVGCVPTHGIAGAWGLLAVALFAERNSTGHRFSSHYGIIKGGSWTFLGVQVLQIVSVGSWAAIITFLELLFIDKIIGLRMSIEEELLGADLTEHAIRQDAPSETNGTHQNGGLNVEPDIEEAVAGESRLQTIPSTGSIQNVNHVPPKNSKPNHDKETIFQKTIYRVGRKRRSVSFQSQGTPSASKSENEENACFHSFEYKNNSFMSDGGVKSQENSGFSPVRRLEVDLHES